MRAVARKLGINANRLVKICDRFQIPHPQTPNPHGLATPPPLPAGPSPAVDIITITSSDARLSPNNDSLALTLEGRGDAEGPYHPELNAWLRQHLVWRQGLVASLPESDRNEVSPNIRQLLRIANLIFGAAQKKGLVPKIAEDHHLRSFDFLYEGVPIKCELRDTKKQVTHADGRRKLQRTGSLLFRIKNISPPDLPTRIEWHERSVGPLQKQVNDIVAALMLAGPIVVRADHERMAGQRQWEAEQFEVRRRARETKQETARRQALLRAANDYRTARDLGEFIQKLERLEHSPDTMIGERSAADWLAWAKVQRDRLNPVSQGTVAFFESINADQQPAP
jgi:hypothetical protein